MPIVDDQRAELYAVPGEACNMISIIMSLSIKFLETSGRDRLVFSIVEPILLDFMRSGNTVIRTSGVRNEFPSYQKNGFPIPGVTDDELFVAPVPFI